MKNMVMMVLAMVLSMSNALAQNENKADTLSIAENNDIKIVQNDSIETVSSNPYNSEGAFDWDLELVEREAGSKLRSSILPQIELGFKFVGGDDADKFKGYTGTEMRYNFAQIGFFPRNSKWWYTLDFGVSFSELDIKNNNMLVADDDNNLSFAPLPEGMHKGRARLSTFGADMKFLVHRQLGRYGSLGFGAMFSGHYNSSHVLNSYRDEQNKKHYQMYHGISRNSFSLRMEYAMDKHTRFFVDFAPKSFFKRGVGPQFSTFTIGYGLSF